jgi:hypothetical protein
MSFYVALFKNLESYIETYIAQLNLAKKRILSWVFKKNANFFAKNKQKKLQ